MCGSYPQLTGPVIMQATFCVSECVHKFCTSLNVCDKELITEEQVISAEWLLIPLCFWAAE